MCFLVISALVEKSTERQICAASCPKEWQLDAWHLHTAVIFTPVIATPGRASAASCKQTNEHPVVLFNGRVKGGRPLWGISMRARKE
jgi:hypothetical protein